ncbi:Ferredoxin [Candidatus Tiddalikarchaeum anstoanum]|nr:Ferredoxin [Candidatus Tiddalikarchaeum anstoanum]
MSPSEPGQEATTHPSVVKAVAREVVRLGAKVIIADSPGGGSAISEQILKNLYTKTGMINLHKLKNVKLNYDTSYFEAPNPKGFIKKYKLMSVLKQADKIINVPKVKTHMLTTLTCSVKNLFGLIPGRDKISYHTRFKDVNDFSRMLIDLAVLVKPTLTIVDGVIGMEGQGPSFGKKKELGLIIAGTNVFETDSAVCDIIGFKAETVPYLKAALDRNLFKKEEYDVKKYKVKFAEPHADILRKLWNVCPSSIKDMMSNIWLDVPNITSKCIGCGMCRDSCPESAITITNNKASINYKKCIRCYCCYELCRYNAITLKKKIF